MSRPFVYAWLALAAAYAAAEPVATLTPGAPAGLEAIVSEDGQWAAGSVAGRDAFCGQPGSPYFYVKAAASVKAALGADFYLVIEFFDSGFGPAAIEYNAPENPYLRGESFLLLNTGVWASAALHITNARLENRQNSGADFRLAYSGPMIIARLALYKELPPSAALPQQERMTAALKASSPASHPGMFYTFGNDADENTAPLFRLIGVSSVESYVTWETCEGKEEGAWDWSHWDKQVQILQDNGLKWVPFLILGPAYSTPNWFRASAEHIPCQCLEHGESSKVESLWNPNLPKRIDRFLKAFAERYRDSGVIESVLLGIQGDFGEAIYSVTGGGWTEIIPGPYHQHGGFWCGDAYALADFRAAMRKQYGSLKALNRAWATAYSSWDAIDYPARGEALKTLRGELLERPGSERRRWLDFTDWYRGSMTRWADWWMADTRKHFPKTPIYLCTGGDAPPEHGSNFAEQCRVAARHRGGVRITNEGSNYAGNFYLTRWVASAGKQYGAYFGFEPASAVDQGGLVARIYNATASGANQLHEYIPNATSSATRLDALHKNLPYLFHADKPVVPVALWYPGVHMTLHWGGFNDKVMQLRDYLDFDYVDETMLRRHSLRRYEILIIVHGSVMEAKDAKRIADWVRHGGHLLVMDVPAFQSVEATNAPEQYLFGASPQGRSLGRGDVLRVSGWDALAAALDKVLCAEKLYGGDLQQNGLYCTQIGKGRFLVLNVGQEPKEMCFITKEGYKPLTVAPISIGDTK